MVLLDTTRQPISNFSKGDIVEHRAEFSIEVKHTFPLGWLNFICKEELYVSDQRHKSHYRKSHVNNKGKL